MGQHADLVVGNSPRGWWRLNETNPAATVVADASGNGHTGIFGSPSSPGQDGVLLDQPSLIGTESDPCMWFDGIDGHITIDDGTDGWLNFATTLAVECVFRPDADQPLAALAHVVNVPFRIDLKIQSDGTLVGIIEVTQADGTGDAALQMTSDPGAIVPGGTYHAVLRYDGSVASLWLNGVNLGTVNYPSVPDTTTGMPLLIARGPSTGVEYFRGWVDEVAVYTSLTDQAIVDLARSALSAGAGTNTANLGGGRNRTGSGYANTTLPAGEVPPGVQPIRVMAQTLPAPTIVDGRPT